jgi:hypothetical protein
MATNWLGLLNSDLGRYHDALDQHEFALETFTAADNTWGCGTAHYGFGKALTGLRLYSAAVARFERAAGLFKVVADERWIGLTRDACDAARLSTISSPHLRGHRTDR